MVQEKRSRVRSLEFMAICAQFNNGSHDAKEARLRCYLKWSHLHLSFLRLLALAIMWKSKSPGTVCKIDDN